MTVTKLDKLGRSTRELLELIERIGKAISLAMTPSRPPERPAVIHSSLYLSAPVYEVLRKIAFDERAKIHDLVMQGIEAVCVSEVIRLLTILSPARNDEPTWNQAER